MMNMDNLDQVILEKYDGDQIADDILEEAARLFSTHYGVWSSKGVDLVGPGPKASSYITQIIDTSTDYA